MGSLVSVVKDIFWASMMVLFLLIVAFFAIRLVKRLGGGTFIGRGATSIGHLATAPA
jgi:hypothetical protein